VPAQGVDELGLLPVRLQVDLEDRPARGEELERVVERGGSGALRS
jgi:hypothetical protein